MLSVVTESATETQALAARLARALVPGDVVALEGELGAGKTTFVRGLAAGLGLDPVEVSSPTFVLCHEYGEDTTSAPRLVHMDAYRLGDATDLESFGGDELIAGADAIIVVEWAERIGAALPAARVTVHMEHAGGDRRAIRIEASGEVADRIRGALAAGGEGASAVHTES
jgi:tRNA threonylcarbamoyladenosine biosynthesis protein TsaE